jgi:glutaminyl-peptide cyclotransferase
MRANRPNALSLRIGFVAAALVLGTAIGVSCSRAQQQPAGKELTLADIPFNGERAYEYLKQICAIGPRITNTPGMKEQQELLTKHFEALGATVTRQEFKDRQGGNPRGKLTPMTNLIVSWHPERKERIFLAAHYDTRPFPDKDLLNPQGTFIGANDGASGIAIMMEMAHEMPKLESRYGVDFVFFDAEEFVYHEREEYFQGSSYFARNYRFQKHDYTYKWGVLLDMVGDADLRIPQERHSVSWAAVRPLVADIWATAKRLGVKEFVPEVGREVLDDHVPLYEVGKIPVCDIIDFDYGPNHAYWHTEQDIPENCSALSLAKVGWVMTEWLKTVK